MAAKKKMGRPPKPPAERRSKVVPLRMSAAEYRKLVRQAKGRGLSISEYLRRKAQEDK